MSFNVISLGMDYSIAYDGDKYELIDMSSGKAKTFDTLREANKARLIARKIFSK